MNALNKLKCIFYDIADWRDKRSNDLYHDLMHDEVEKSAIPRKGQSWDSVVREYWPSIESAFYEFLENRYKLPFDAMYLSWKKNGYSDSAFFERINDEFLAFQAIRQTIRNTRLVQEITAATSHQPKQLA